MGTNVVQLSTGLAAKMVHEGSAVGGLAELLNNCQINIYAGSVPATADADGTGATLLASIVKSGAGTYNLTWDTTLLNGLLAKPSSDTWEAPLSGGIAASGTAAFWRILLTGDSNGASTTALRIQGQAGNDSTFSLFLNSTALVSGNPLALSAFQIQLPVN